MSVSSIGSTSLYGFIDRMAMSAMRQKSQSQGSTFNPFAATESGSNSEMQPMKPQGGQMGPPPPPPPMDASKMASRIIETEDANGDGALSADESRLASDLFTKLDTNSDGALSSEELVTGLESDRRSSMASSILASEDTNGDSVLSVDETGLASADFSRLDTDGDGKVTSEELQAAIKARDAERSKEMSAMSATAQETQLAASTTKYDSLQALIEAIGKNQASSAYSNQNNWLYQILQASSSNLTVSA